MFGIHGDFRSPDDVSHLLDLLPSRGFGKDEEYLGRINRHTKRKRYRPVGMWALHSIPSISSDAPQDHIAFLLDLLEPKSVVIAELQNTKGYNVGFWLHYAVPRGTVGYSLSSEILQRVSALCGHIVFEYDLLPEDDEDVV